MSDLIEKAVDGWQDTRERTATGSVGGHEVCLKKETYQKEQRGPTTWRVAVYLEDATLPTESKKDIDASVAQRHFEQLVANHNLTEQD